MPLFLRVAKLRISRSFAPHVSSHLYVLRILRTFAPSRLLDLHALGVLLTHLIYAPYVAFLRAYRTLFVCVKIVLGWICSPLKCSILQGLY